MQKKIPMRQCCGCLTMFPKRELIRVVRAPSGEVSIDLVGKAQGRGAYLCKSADCLKKAQKSGKIARALEVNIPDEVYAQMESELTNG